MKRKILFLTTVLIIVLASCACVYATTYTSTASMNGNSSLAGKVRSYDAGKHKISILVKTTGGTGYNPVKITLNKKTLTGSSSKGTKTVNLATRNKTYSATYASQAKGKYYYFFNTSGSYPWSSNKVVMKSY